MKALNTMEMKDSLTEAIGALQTHSLWAFAVIILSATVTYYHLLRGLYRITLHPLATFPGPKSRAISHIPLARSMVRGSLPHDLHTLHSKYGEVIRFAPNMLSFISADAWEDIFGHSASRRFQRWGYTRTRPDVDHLLSANDADHARQKRLINHAFSEKALKGQEAIISSHIDMLLNQLVSRTEQTGETIVDMGQWLDFTTVDIIGDLAFGASFGCLEAGAYNPWISLLFSFIKALSLINATKLFPVVFPLLMLLLPKKDLSRRAEHIKLSAAKVHARLSAGENPSRRDFWSYILRHNDDKGMSVPEMESNASLFITAGSETISTALSGALWLLVQHPSALDTLRNELTHSFNAESDINMTSVAGLPYLQAAVYEALRVYPPVAGGLQRVAPQGGADVAGHHVPEGTIVIVPQLPTYRSETNFQHASSFKPERWLQGRDAPAWAAHDRKQAFQPFSMGPRGCAGKNLAYAEMKLVLARLVWRFELGAVDERFDIERQKVFIFRERPPLNLRIRARSGGTG